MDIEKVKNHIEFNIKQENKILKLISDFKEKQRELSAHILINPIVDYGKNDKTLMKIRKQMKGIRKQIVHIHFNKTYFNQGKINNKNF